MHHDENPVERLKDLLNTPDSKSGIKVLCRQLLKSLNLTTAPIPLNPICKRFKLKVNYKNFITNEDSFLKLTQTGFEIDISRHKNWRRNRFTIAHELSHLIIFNILGKPINSYNRIQHDEIERLCDICASEMLVSESQLESSLKEFGISSAGLKKLYDKFLISYDALLLRISEYLDANIIIWRKYARNQKDKNEYRVYRHFPNYKWANKSIWLPNGCTTKHISPVPFEVLEDTTVIDDFKILINSKVVSCNSIIISFPSSRHFINSLPIFSDIVVADESVYDNCFLMILFNNKSKFDHVKDAFLKNDKS